ncbi:hypothetical protein DKP78_17045 [Enterococcus faecium]|nr:hypothetical protein DKP78_17045 [Enterococcus faecium]
MHEPRPPDQFAVWPNRQTRTIRHNHTDTDTQHTHTRTHTQTHTPSHTHTYRHALTVNTDFFCTVLKSSE